MLCACVPWLIIIVVVFVQMQSLLIVFYKKQIFQERSLHYAVKPSELFVPMPLSL
jgi:hypothetical protein